MNVSKYVLMSLAILMVLVNVGFGATIYVNISGAGTTCSGSSTSYTTVPLAVNNSADGDLIIICGNGSGAINIGRTIINKSLIIEGENNSAATILAPVNGGMNNGTFFVTNNSAVEFRNLTFQNSSASGTVFVYANTNQTGSVNFTRILFRNNALGAVFHNSSDVTFTGVTFENSTDSLRADNGTLVVNLSNVNFTNVTGPVFANVSTGTLTGNVRVMNTSVVVQVLNGSTLTTVSSYNITTNHLTFTFTNLRNLSVTTTFRSSAPVDPDRCGSSTQQYCLLVSELVNFSAQGTARIDSLSLYYNVSKISGSVTEDSIYVGRWGDAGWALVGRTTQDTAGDSVTYGPLSGFSYYGAVGFIAASSSGDSGSSSRKALELSDPEFSCPDNTVTFTATSKGSPVDDVRIRVLSDTTSVSVGEDTTDSDGEATVTLSTSSTYRTSTSPPLGYEDPDEVTFDFSVCGAAAAPVEEPEAEEEETAPAPVEQPPAPAPSTPVVETPPAPAPEPTPAPAEEPAMEEEPETVTPPAMEEAAPPATGGPDLGLIVGVVVVIAVVLGAIYFFVMGGGAKK